MDCIGQLILTQQATDDSMAWARKILPMASDGTVLIARYLTQARGRQGRRWILAQGQITHTVILKPEPFTPSEQSLATLNMALTLGLWSLLHKHGVTIKWPNDLYLNNKKLGGMLFENLWHGDMLTGIVVGYSININNSCIGNEILDPIATSLADATGKQFNLALMQTELFASLSQFYATWKRREYFEIFRLWRLAQGYLGKSIKVHHKDGSLFEGTAQDVLPNGDLILALTTSNRTTRVTFSQVEDVFI
jgi:BirA family biotin operon repressor/biotin-[acetyl-CoA-carboxylase] ligase